MVTLTPSPPFFALSHPRRHVYALYCSPANLVQSPAPPNEYSLIQYCKATRDPLVSSVFTEPLLLAPPQSGHQLCYHPSGVTHILTVCSLFRCHQYGDRLRAMKTHTLRKAAERAHAVPYNDLVTPIPPIHSPRLFPRPLLCSLSRLHAVLSRCSI